MSAPHLAISQVDVSDLPTTSARIRRLKDMGYRQAEIARRLAISDQHVSNVVRGPRPKSERHQGVSEPAKAFRMDAHPLPARVAVEAGGVVRLPPEWGVAVGAVYVVRNFAGDIVLMRAEQAGAVARTGGASATDDFIAERRLEAMREFDD